MRSLADFGEIRIFGEKAVAGMDRVDIGDFRRADHVGNVQIAFRAARRPDADGFVREAHMQRVAVGFGIDGDGGDAQFLAGANHPQGDLTAIGDQNFAKHRLANETWRSYFCLVLVLGLGGPDRKQRLAILDRLAIFDQHAHHFPAHVGLDFIHQLHGFDDAHDLALFESASPILTKGAASGLGGGIKGPDDR